MYKLVSISGWWYMVDQYLGVLYWCSPLVQVYYYINVCCYCKLVQYLVLGDI